MMNRFRCISIIVLSAVLPGCDTISGVFKSGDNLAPPTPLTDIKPTVSLSSVWSKNISGSGNQDFVNLKPSIAGGLVFVASRDGTVMAVDAVSGRTKWRVNTNTRLGGGPGLGDELVLLGSSEGEVIALSAVDGEEKWRSQVTSEVLSVPSAAAGVVVARAIDGRLFGLSSADGKRLWTYDRSVPALTLRGNSSPVVAGALVVYGSDGGKLSALSLKEGLPYWEKSVAFPSGRSELDRIVDIDGSPLVVNGVVYAASYQGSVVALELENARSLWSRSLLTASDLGVDHRNLYVADAEGNVWALDRRDGTPLWKQDKLQNRAVTGPVVVDKYVVVGDYAGYQHWLSVDDGRFAARIKTSSSGVGSPVITDGKTAYSYSKDGELTATRVSR